MKRILFGSLTLVGGLFATATSVEAQALPSGQQFNTEYKFVAPPQRGQRGGVESVRFRWLYTRCW